LDISSSFQLANYVVLDLLVGSVESKSHAAYATG